MREDQGERATLSWLAFHQDVTPVVPHHFPADGKPQPGSVLLGGIEGNEYLGKIFRFDSAPLVHNGYFMAVVEPFGSEGNSSSIIQTRFP